MGPDWVGLSITKLQYRNQLQTSKWDQGSQMGGTQGKERGALSQETWQDVKPFKGSVRSLKPMLPDRKSIIGRFPSETGRNRLIYRKRILVGVTVYSVFLACQAPTTFSHQFVLNWVAPPLSSVLDQLNYQIVLWKTNLVYSTMPALCLHFR